VFTVLRGQYGWGPYDLNGVHQMGPTECAVSFWHFHRSRWWALAFAIGGIVLCAMAVMDINGRKRWRRPEA
jgi:hypothetical protein